MMERRDWWKFAACMVSVACIGWHDGSGGPLIPDIRARLGINYFQTSFVFITSFSGYLAAASLNHALVSKFGPAKVFTLAPAVQLGGALLLFCLPSYPTLLLCYSVMGFGLALQDAHLNTFVSRLSNADVMLGAIHAMYGTSAIISPVVATRLLAKGMPFYRFYTLNATFAFITFSAIIFSFVGPEWADGPTRAASTIPREEEETLLPPSGIVRNGHDNLESTSAPVSEVVQSLTIRRGLVFVFFHVGSQIGEAGWVVSFLRTQRGGGDRSGYGSAVFFTGLAASRIILLPITRALGRTRAIATYLVVAFASQVLVASVSEFTVDLVGIGVFGAMHGPIFPIMISLITGAVPKHHQPSAILLMSLTGQAGSACFPFLVGVLAEALGLELLSYIQMILVLAMLSALHLFSRSVRSKETFDLREPLHPA
ncbi:MFS general substrate transporter [Meredithblackwellia eburnea MCA 4105]